MITNDTPTNEAILSNVGGIGEFKIRNSAKAFSILSSGLYANKIRAIVRELSCNARDSHVDAGRADRPFEVHLPTDLEPWFAIRDYGTGLDHDQVTEIYTTYFESTKTASNEFIGALGLGSKSPFSYTDNFTVTAIKDRMQRIYTAFINEQGVPSIALMFEEETGEDNGVEVKFGVEDRWDARKFADEASSVYKYFDIQPEFTGAPCKVRTIEYADKDIIPGVSLLDGYMHNPVAVMGNIAYPINVPNAESNLGSLAKLLEQPLEMRFEIGELDIQASREGLSYIPQTIKAIKKKLAALNDALADVIAEQASKIDCEWERAFFLESKHRNSRMWDPAIEQYVKVSGFELFEPQHWHSLKIFDVDEKDLQNEYNIKINAFSYSRGSLSASTITSNKTRNPHNYNDYLYVWQFQVDPSVTFVVNDTKIGAAERAKYHWKKNTDSHRSNVYVLSALDKDKPMKTKEFFELLHNPPNVMNASDLDEKPRKASVRSDAAVSILRLEPTSTWKRRGEHVWKDVGTLASINSSDTFYYLPLSGYALVSEYGMQDAKELAITILTSDLFKDVKTIYGVRKGDIKNIQKRSNWINVEDYVVKTLQTLDEKFVKRVAKSALTERGVYTDYSKEVLKLIEKSDSEFINVANKVAGVQCIQLGYMSTRAIKQLVRRYSDQGIKCPLTVGEEVADKLEKSLAAYPMLKLIDARNVPSLTVAEYVNMVDSVRSKELA